MFENPRRGKQARNFPTNGKKILDRKSSSEQIFSENCRWVQKNNKTQSQLRQALDYRISYQASRCDIQYSCLLLLHGKTDTRKQAVG